MKLLSPAVAALATAALAASLNGQARVEYEIAFPQAEQHEARVSATLHGVPAGPLQVRMSRSSPGRYGAHAFAKNVYDVRAADGQGRPLEVTRPDAHGWTVAGHDGTVRLEYTVWGDRVDGTYLGIDRSHAHLNLPAVFAWARGMEHAPIRLRIHPREGWAIATQLRPTADGTVFTAPNLQWFLDSPVELGPLTVRSWRTAYAGGAQTWRMAVHHLGAAAEVDSFAAMAARVVDEAVAVWGEPPGLDGGTYTFMADVLPWAARDAMEHRNSAVLTHRDALADPAVRVELLGRLAHELVHAWNVERLRPRSLEPFDFERENLSPELWFAEGVTDYLGRIIVRRAGYRTDDELAGALGEAVDAVVNGPGRRHGSPVDMSLQAPFADAGGSLDPVNRQNTYISYYTEGAALGLALDLTLRTRFGLSLEDWLRALWGRYGRPQSPALAPERPYTLDDLQAVLGEVTGDPAFAADFFARYVRGREVPDFGRLLAAAGFLLAPAAPGKPYLGAFLDDDPGAVFVMSVTETGSFHSAGITGGDLVHSVDGEPTTSAAALGAIIGRHRPGDVVQVEVSGRGRRFTVPVTLRERTDLRLVTYERAGMPVTDAIRRFRASWLGSRVR